MLEGIKVLNKIAETDKPSWWWIPLVLFIAMILIIGSIIISKENINSHYEWISSIIGIFIIVIYLVTIPQVPTGEYTYQVTIDDSVNFKEFDDMYCVISKEGEIYTIEDK